MDIYIKKQDLEKDILSDYFFDIAIANNDVITDKSIMTSCLMCIFTDNNRHQLGRYIDNVELGNRYYNLKKLTDENISNYQSGIKESLKWLIKDKVVLDIIVSSENQGNAIMTNIKITKIDKTELNFIYSLDTSLELLEI